MTDAEKFQKLMEVAWKHGWKRHYHRRPERASKDWTYKPITASERTHLMFDHDFIKALCKAKFFSPEYLENDMKIWERGMDLALKSANQRWIDVIQVLATSTDRIGYLWEVFGNE